MKDLKQFLIEAKNEKRAVVTFTHANPPTSEHQKLFNKVIQEAQKDRATPHIFISTIQDQFKYPLLYEQKLRFLNLSLDKNIFKTIHKADNIDDALGKLIKENYNNITLLVEASNIKRITQYVKESYPDVLIKVTSSGIKNIDSQENIFERNAFQKNKISNLSNRFSKELFDTMLVNIGKIPLNEEFDQPYATTKLTTESDSAINWTQIDQNQKIAEFKFGDSKVKLTFDKDTIKNIWTLKYDVMSSVWNNLTRQSDIRNINLQELVAGISQSITQFLDAGHENLQFTFLHQRDTSQTSIKAAIRNCLTLCADSNDELKIRSTEVGNKTVFALYKEKNNSEIVDIVSSYSIDRSKLPQIRRDQHKHFLDFLESNSVSWIETTIRVNDILPTQNKLNLAKVREKKLKYAARDESVLKPLLISKDNHLLDGHHLWKALLDTESNMLVSAYKINIDIEQLVDLALRFGGSEIKDINDQILSVQEQNILKRLNKK
jgi:hypothetical protein